MKRIALSLFALVACVAGAADLQVEVTGVEGDRGEVLVALYDKADTWLKKPLKVQRARATTGTVQVVFNDLAEADYALSAFHDEDGNRRLSSNGMGIPIEPFGFSRDAMGSFGPPSFDDAKVTVGAAGGKIAISLQALKP